MLQQTSKKNSLHENVNQNKVDSCVLSVQYFIYEKLTKLKHKKTEKQKRRRNLIKFLNIFLPKLIIKLMKWNTTQTKRKRIHDYVPHAGNLAQKAKYKLSRPEELLISLLSTFFAPQCLQFYYHLDLREYNETNK